MEKNTTKASSKYKNIIIPIVLMLLIIFSVLGATYWTSNEISRLNQASLYASHQATNIQNIKNSIFNIDLYAQNIDRFGLNNNQSEIELENIEVNLSALQTVSDELSHSINIFQQGGQITLPSGESLNIQPLTTPELITNIRMAEQYWDPFNRLINSFEQALAAGKLNTDTIGFATDYARRFSDKLYFEFSDLAEKLTSQAKYKNQTMQLIILAGLILAISLFTYIIFVALRQLIRGDNALEAAIRETNDIMRTVHDGLFLLDSNYQIGHEYSKELVNILGEKDIGGKSIEDLLSNFISDKDMETTKEYLEQMFNSGVIEELVQDLNPLQEIRVHIEDDRGNSQFKYLDFNFSRVYEKKEIVRVLVSISDITQTVELQKRMAAAQEKHNEELELLASILHVDGATLNNFLIHANKTANKINQILMSKSLSSMKLREKLDFIFREAHSLKGDASAIRLSNYVNLMANFENKLRQIREKANLNGNDFLPLAIELDTLIEFNDKVSEINERLRKGKLSDTVETIPTSSASENQENSSPININKTFFNQFAHDIAQRNHREVILQCHDLDTRVLSSEQQSTIKDLGIQLLRNAIVHGIETPEQREHVGKSPAGHVTMALQKETDNKIIFTVEDDGQGINFNKLRKLAIKNGAFSHGDEISERDLIKFMLKPGVSTMEDVNQDAGQGVGSDLILSHIRSLGGKIHVSSKAGEYTRFKIAFSAEK